MHRALGLVSRCLLAVVLVGVAAPGERAHACSCPGFSLVAQLPAADATGVPVDTPLLVSVLALAGEASVVLETDQGVPVALTELARLPSSLACHSDLVLLAPNAALAPNQRYVLRLDGSSDERALPEGVSFTTGDTSAAPGGAAALTVHHFRHDVEEASSCAPPNPTGNAWPSVAYVFVEMGVGSPPVMVGVRSPDGAGGWVEANGLLLDPGRPVVRIPQASPTDCLELTVRDLTGSVVETRDLCNPTRCTSRSDYFENVVQWEDWSEVPEGSCAAPPTTDDGDDGCSSGPHPTTTLLALLLAALLVVRSRRRPVR